MTTAAARLGDFAAVLSLLERRERRRAEALAAYAGELFALAEQGDRAGADVAAHERLLQTIDRWATELERHWPPADGNGTPPALRGLAERHRERPFDRVALGGVVSAARARCSAARPETPAIAQAAAERLGGALAEAQLGEPISPTLIRFTGALVRLALLQNLGLHLAAGRCPLPISDLAVTGPRPDLRATVRAVRQECQRLRPLLLGVAPALVDLPAGYDTAGVFLLLAALELLSELEEADSDFLHRPPRLGRWTIRRLLWRARLRGLGAVE